MNVVFTLEMNQSTQETENVQNLTSSSWQSILVKLRRTKIVTKFEKKYSNYDIVKNKYILCGVKIHATKIEKVLKTFISIYSVAQKFPNL